MGPQVSTRLAVAGVDLRNWELRVPIVLSRRAYLLQYFYAIFRHRAFDKQETCVVLTRDFRKDREGHEHRTRGQDAALASPPPDQKNRARAGGLELEIRAGLVPPPARGGATRCLGSRALCPILCLHEPQTCPSRVPSSSTRQVRSVNALRRRGPR